MNNLISQTFGLIFFGIVVTFISCERNTNFSNPQSLEIDNALGKVNDETISVKQRVSSNKRAEVLIESIDVDSLKIAYLFRVANRYYNLYYFEDYKRVCVKLVNETFTSGDSIRLAKAYGYLGDYYYKASVSDTALYYYLKGDKILEKKQMKTMRAENFIAMSRVKSLAGEYTGAERYITQALGLLEKDDFQQNYEAYTILGFISNELKNYEHSLDAHSKAYEIVIQNKIGNSQHQSAVSLNNIGNVYQNLNKHNKALEFFDKAIKEKGLYVDRPDLYALLLDNIAYSNFKEKKFKTVMPLFNRALKIRDSLGLQSYVVLSRIRISEYLAVVGDTTNSVYHASKALDIARQNLEPNDVLVALKQILRVDKSNAGVNSVNYIRISDSLQQAERRIKDKFARIQFETQEISDKNSELNQKNRNLTWFFSGTVMIGLLLFVIRTQRAKNRELLLKQAQQKANEDIYNLMLSQQNKMEEGRIREKKRIAQELHDGVLGRLFGARLNLDSLNRSTDQESRDRTINYLNELKNIEQDLREISHDLNREKTVLINNFVAILNNLFEEQSQNFEPEVSTSIDSAIQWDEISNNLKINIYRIFQESLQNINKYAKASNIDAKLYLESDNLHLKITDDGLGFAVDKKKSGIGLQNMMSRTDECGGLFDIESAKGKGTTIHIIFPLIDKAQEDSAPEIRPAIA